MSDCRQCVDFEWCKEYEECGLFKPKIMTKADEIRAMTDEELARWIADDLIEPGYYEGDTCYEIWLDWLRQEVGE